MYVYNYIIIITLCIIIVVVGIIIIIILLETNALYAFDNIGTPGKWRLEISCSMAIWCDRVGSVGILYYGKIKHDYLVCIKYNPCQVVYQLLKLFMPTIITG